MSARNITESTILPLVAFLKANMPAALADLRVERGDARVSTEPPKEYFIYEGAHSYKCPAVFVISDSVDLMKSAGPSSIMATVKVKVSVVIEDSKQDALTIKAWRYQDALYQVLDQAQIITDDEMVKLIVIVQGFQYSPTFIDDLDKKSTQNAFRKEVLIDCDVRHFEKP